MTCLPRPVMKTNCSIPASRASSTAYWMAGLSTTGSISLGIALVAGRKRVPIPAAGTTALVTVACAGTDGVGCWVEVMAQTLVGQALVAGDLTGPSSAQSHHEPRARSHSRVAQAGAKTP